MKVVILCGGRGTRLQEETEWRPKPLIDVGGRPILWHIMKRYAHYGFTDFLLCLGYKGDMLKQYFLNYQAMRSDFTVRLGALKGVEYHGNHLEAGWTVTEVGRQPWIIQGVMRTSEAVTPMPGIQYSFYLFTFIYFTLSIFVIFLLKRQIQMVPKLYDR